MTHEPECPNNINGEPFPKWSDDCITCKPIRAAYKRGREDQTTSCAHLHDPSAEAMDTLKAVLGWNDAQPYGGLIPNIRGGEQQ